MNPFQERLAIRIHGDWIGKVISQVHVNETLLKILVVEQHHTVKSAKEIHTEVQRQKAK
jgi:hypothetical protein